MASPPPLAFLFTSRPSEILNLFVKTFLVIVRVPSYAKSGNAYRETSQAKARAEGDSLRSCHSISIFEANYDAGSQVPNIRDDEIEAFSRLCPFVILLESGICHIKVS